MESRLALVFYFPHHKIGGVSILFLRMAEALSSEYLVYVADYSDGYMAKNISKNIKLFCIDQEYYFPENSIFIFQSFLPWRFPFLEKVKPSSRIFFWNLHPKNFDPSIFNEKSNFNLFKIISKIVNIFAWKRIIKVKKLINYLIQNKALEFMDVENLRSTEEIIGEKLHINNFLPVATPKLIKRKNFDLVSNEIKLGWVGRLADFKYRILEHLMHRLSGLNIENKDITLIIIGDGDYGDYLKKEAILLSSNRFKIIFLGELSPQDLHQYLRENIDIVFSMGSSALEAASIGLPVFLTDYSYDKIKKKYKFSLIYEKYGYCLGENIVDESYENECSLKYSIINILKDYELYSDLCFKYWETNFSLDSVAISLKNRINSTTATFGNMKKRGYFEPDKLGLFMRSAGWWLRNRYSKEITGFRHDC